MLCIPGCLPRRPLLLERHVITTKQDRGQNALEVRLLCEQLLPRQLDVIPLQVGIERYDELSRRRGQVIYDRGRLYSSLVAYSPPQPAYGMRTWRPTYSRPCAASMSRADAILRLSCVATDWLSITCSVAQLSERAVTDRVQQLGTRPFGRGCSPGAGRYALALRLADGIGEVRSSQEPSKGEQGFCVLASKLASCAYAAGAAGFGRR